MRKYFFCYSEKLSKYLTKKGFKYICMAYASSTMQKFTLFEMNDNLKRALDEYSSEKSGRK